MRSNAEKLEYCISTNAYLERYEYKGKTYIIHSGVNFGKLPELIKENKHLYLCKVAGHTGWNGRGNTDYFNPCLVIMSKKYKGYISLDYTRQTRKETYLEAESIFNSYKP